MSKKKDKGLHVRKPKLIPVDRPPALPSSTHSVQLGCANKMFVTVTVDDDKNPVEVFATAGKAGMCITSQLATLCRCISVGLRSGIPVKHYAHSIRNIQCDAPVLGGAKSCGDGIAQVLEEYIVKEEE